MNGIIDYELRMVVQVNFHGVDTSMIDHHCLRTIKSKSMTVMFIYKVSLLSNKSWLIGL